MLFSYRNQKLGNLWDEVIYPGMKKAIICSLLSTQDLVEYRKVMYKMWLDVVYTKWYKLCSNNFHRFRKSIQSAISCVLITSTDSESLYKVL